MMGLHTKLVFTHIFDRSPVLMDAPTVYPKGVLTTQPRVAHKVSAPWVNGAPISSLPRRGCTISPPCATPSGLVCQHGALLPRVRSLRE